MEIKPVQKMVVVEAKMKLMFAFPTNVSPAEIQAAFDQLKEAFLVTSNKKNIATIDSEGAKIKILRDWDVETPWNSSITFGSEF